MTLDWVQVALTVRLSFPGGAADKSGLLHVRDQILAINDQDITHMARIEAWNLLKKQPDGMVRLTIRKWLPQGPGTAAPDPVSQTAATDSASSPAASVQFSTAQSAAPKPSNPSQSSVSQLASSNPTPAGSVSAVTRPTALPAGARSDTRPVITGVTPKSGPLASPVVVLPQA